MTQILIGVTHKYNNEMSVTVEFHGDNYYFDIEISIEQARQMMISLELALNNAERVEKDGETESL